MRLANELFAVKSYYAAAQAYEDALERTKDSFSVANNLSFAYDIMGNVPKAIAWYGFLAKNDSLEERQMLRYAILLRQNGDVEKSELWLLNTLTLNSQNATAKALLSNQSSKDELTDYFTNPENSHLSKESDISIHLINNEEAIVTSSKRNTAAIMRTAGQPRVYFYDMYRVSVSEDGGFGTMQQIRGKVTPNFMMVPLFLTPLVVTYILQEITLLRENA